MLYSNSLYSFTKQDFRMHILIIHREVREKKRHEKLGYLVHLPWKKYCLGQPSMFLGFFLPFCLCACYTRLNFPFFQSFSIIQTNIFHLSIFVGRFHFSHDSVQLVLLYAKHPLSNRIHVLLQPSKTLCCYWLRSRLCRDVGAAIPRNAWNIARTFPWGVKRLPVRQDASVSGLD